MSETSQNAKNIHRHSASGIIFASILLLCIVIVSLVITFTALGKDEQPSKKDPASNDVENGDDSKNPEDNTDNGNNSGNSGNQSGSQITPSGNKTIAVNNDKIYRGSLIFLSETSPYNRPIEELLTRTAMDKLSDDKLRDEYNFKRLSIGHTGDFILDNKRLYLDIDATDALRKMMAAYVKETGHKNIWLINAYYYDRSEDIASTANVNEALLNPHAAGLAVDIKISTADGKQIPLKNDYSGYPSAEYYGWFIKNCHKYGFVHAGDTENKYSTFRYIGVAHATYMAKNNVSFTEYLNTVKTKTSRNRLVISDASGKEWWVYYVKASDGASTDIPVFGNLYSVSGNNTDGFIVTIDTSGL